MKVCFVTTSFPAYKDDVQSPFIFQLAKHLVQQGVELTVVCPFYKKSTHKKEIIEGIPVSRFSYFFRPIQTLTEKGGVGDFRKNIWSLFQLPFFLLGMFFATYRVSAHADLIHCQWSLSALPGVFVKFLRRKKLLVSLRGEDLKAMHHRLMKPIFLWILSHADYVHSNNKYHINEVRQFTPHVRVIYNGVDTNLFYPQPKRPLREELHLPSKKIIVLFVGWLIERKGVHHLIEAIPLILRHTKNVLFVLVGDGVLREQLVARTQELGIANAVLFVGKKTQTETAKYMAAADIFVLPSLYEGMPNVVMEAFASGLPVVATNVCGTSELVQNGVNGLLIQKDDSHLLGKTLLDLILRGSFRRTLGLAALRTITTHHFTWKKSASLHIRLYKDILDKK